jgi:hypothetical protein
MNWVRHASSPNVLTRSSTSDPAKGRRLFHGRLLQTGRGGVMHRSTAEKLHANRLSLMAGEKRATALLPARTGGICAVLAFVTVTIGSIAGGLAQPDAYSFANDDRSDLGA